MIFAMLVIGGITRLTGSGLSMAEWRPLVGILPPLGAAEWERVFALYRETPQYQIVNDWMTLDDFKQIFFWEYLHRFFGRLIGVVALAPWLFFVWTKRLPRSLARRVFIAIVLGALQGGVGWFMVRSGLVGRPEVSHIRLAAHLLFAIVIAQWILWIVLDLHYPASRKSRIRNALPLLTFALLTTLVLQMLYGAFMAGTRAGLLFPSFPDMNGSYLPQPFFVGKSILEDLLYNPQAIHWVHRALGTGLLVLASAAGWMQWRSGSAVVPTWSGTALVALVWIQVATGALAALYQVPIPLGALHQAGAFVTLSCAVVFLHALLRDGAEPFVATRREAAS